MSADDEIPDTAQTNSLFDRDKARRAARSGTRPGERCRAPAAAYRPQIDRNRCEGKSDCAQVCPYGVFEIRRIDDVDFDALTFLGRWKSRAHRRQTAYAPLADACRACGLCVVACPEDAIELEHRGSTP